MLFQEVYSDFFGSGVKSIKYWQFVVDVVLYLDVVSSVVGYVSQYCVAV